MPFIATCTYCRASKFRVPYKKRGTFATCPKCEREFMLTPESGADRPLMKYNDLPFDDPDEDDDREASSELIETVPDQPAIDESAIDVESKLIASPTVVASVGAKKSGDLPLRLALVSCVLFGLAILATQFPYGRVIAVPFALSGLLLAVMGWLGLERYRWIGISGMVLNGLTLALLLVLPTWLGVSTWLPEDTEPVDQKVPLAMFRDGSPARSVEWVDAAKAVWEFNDIRVAVGAVSIGRADPSARTGEKAKERILRITLVISNLGVSRALEFAGWNSPPSYESRLTVGGLAVANRSGSVDPSFVPPSKSLETVLAFAVPEKLDDLRLELPAAAIGGTEPVRFQIPKAMISSR